jgi:hypothetical protein
MGLGGLEGLGGDLPDPPKLQALEAFDDVSY